MVRIWSARLLMGRLVAGLWLGAMLASCSGGAIPDVTPTARPLPAMRWDHRPEADAWTRASLKALRSHGQVLATLVPDDIETYCPNYGDAAPSQRRAFWAGLLSALAKHESTWNPQAVGGGGRWFGLVQIAPATARGYGCAARSGAELRDGTANLSCAIRIWSVTVARDGVVSAGGRGVAADWGPFHRADKRRDMAAWTRTQRYCRK